MKTRSFLTVLAVSAACYWSACSVFADGYVTPVLPPDMEVLPPKPAVSKPVLDAAGRPAVFSRPSRGGAQSGVKPGSGVRNGKAAFVVTTTADGGPGSLRQAIASAASGSDTISFAVPLPAVIKLTNALTIFYSMKILGPGPENLTVMRSDAPGTPAFRVFRVRETASDVTIAGMTIKNGYAVTPSTGDNIGGGIYSSAPLTLSNCVVTANRVPYFEDGFGAHRGLGAGVFTTRQLLLRNSTLTGNHAAIGGGGLFALHASGVVGESSTISANIVGEPPSPPSITNEGGGIVFQGCAGSLLRNCTVSENYTFGSGSGGGVLNLAVGGEHSSLTIESCTIVSNYATFGAGVNSAATTEFGPWSTAITTTKSSIVAGNFGGPGFEVVTNSTVFGTNTLAYIVSLGNNLDGDGTSGFVDGVNGDIVGSVGSPIDPLLTPLQRNGGPTPTHAPYCSSPVVDKGSCVTSSGGTLTTDQRGKARPYGIACDIGAVEQHPVGCGDLNHDCVVDFADFLLFQQHYGKRPGNVGWLPEADYNSNNVGDLGDYYIWYNCYLDFIR